jgi:urate oxidase
MNTTDSEFVGFAQDRYTTLPEATDRVLATAVTARWRHRDALVSDALVSDALVDGRPEIDWQESYDGAREALVGAFTGTYSRALQQTLYAMGSAVLAARPEIVEVRLSLPNKHHLLVDLSRFGQPNANEVFHADDRPYGLIQGTVLRDDAPPAEPAWDSPWSS